MRTWAAIALLALVALTGLTALLYDLSRHAFPGNGDGASIVLEASSMAHGNLALRGWVTPLDSYWLSDAPFYAAFVAVQGMGFNLVHLVPAFIGAVVVLVGACLAALDRRPGPAALGALSVVAIVGLPSLNLARIFLQGPGHVVTALWCLLAFACLRSGRLGWRWVAAIALLAAATISDLLAVAFGVVPVFLVGMLVMARARSVRPGMAPVSAAVAGSVLALVIRLAADVAGTYQVINPTEKAAYGQMGRNLVHAFQYGANLLGIGSSPLVRGVTPTALELVHLAGLVMMVAVLAVAVSLLRQVAVGDRPEPPPDRRAGAPSRPDAPADTAPAFFLDGALLFGMAGSVCVFSYLSTFSSTSFERYLTAGVIFGAVLTGRYLAVVAGHVPPGWWRRSLAVTVGGVFLAYAAVTGYYLHPRPIAVAYGSVSRFLEAHHLKEGLADYWTAQTLTVASGGRVLVRPVIAGGDGRLVPHQQYSEPSWYRGHRFNFFVIAERQRGPFFKKTSASAAGSTFGAPAHTYTVDGYEVLVWRTPRALPPAPATA